MYIHTPENGTTVSAAVEQAQAIARETHEPVLCIIGAQVRTVVVSMDDDTDELCDLMKPDALFGKTFHAIRALSWGMKHGSGSDTQVDPRIAKGVRHSWLEELYPYPQDQAGSTLELWQKMVTLVLLAVDKEIASGQWQRVNKPGQLREREHRAHLTLYRLWSEHQWMDLALLEAAASQAANHLESHAGVIRAVVRTRKLDMNPV